jgi:hypothetical protein
MDSTDVSIPAASAGTPPTQPAPATPAPIQSSVPGGNDNCANCGAPLALDQRYCLQCGQRRGDPRLPFMDAVVLMDAVQRTQNAPPPPPPAKKRRGGISPNAALITGIGVLLLALGLGVLIGRSGNNETASAPQTPQVITVEGNAGGGGGEATPTTGGSSTSNKKAPKSKTEKAAKKQEAESQAGAEEVLKPKEGVKLPPAKVQPGGKCPPGSAGCKGEEFTGEFFGE